MGFQLECKPACNAIIHLIYEPDLKEMLTVNVLISLRNKAFVSDLEVMY